MIMKNLNGDEWLTYLLQFFFTQFYKFVNLNKVQPYQLTFNFSSLEKMHLEVRAHPWLYNHPTSQQYSPSLFPFTEHHNCLGSNMTFSSLADFCMLPSKSSRTNSCMIKISSQITYQKGFPLVLQVLSSSRTLPSILRRNEEKEKSFLETHPHPNS